MNIQTVAGACIFKKNKILLLQQSADEKDGAPGGWGPPAGHGEEGEKLVQVAIRETKEESNLDVLPYGIVESGLYRASDRNNYLIVVYACNAEDINRLKIDGKEIVDYQWVSLEDLKSNKYILRHPMLMPILIKAFNNNIYPLEAFKDEDIQV